MAWLGEQAGGETLALPTGSPTGLKSMLRTLFCMLVTAVWTFVMFLFSSGAVLITGRGSASMFWVRRGWSPVLVWAGGGKVEVTGLENVDPERPTIYVCNHQSTVDIPVVFMSLPGVDLRFVVKSQLRHVPLIGWYMRLAKFVFVDRSNREKAVASLQKAGEQIRNGTSVIVFPEGTRSADGRILPFKKGPFALAVQANVSICPMAIEGSGKLMPKNSWRFRPGPIRVRIGEPIDPAAFGDDKDALIRHTRNAVIDLNVALGGPGGNKEDAVAAQGMEGIGRSATPQA